VGVEIKYLNLYSIEVNTMAEEKTVKQDPARKGGETVSQD
jgi:hypothetical protein